MNQEKKQIIILVVLFVVLGFVGYRTMNTVSTPPSIDQTKAASASNPSGTQIQPVEAIQDADLEAIDIDGLMQKIRDVEFVYSDNNPSRNPARPVLTVFITGPTDQNSAPTGSGSLRLISQRKNVTGIIWDPNDPVAVVNTDVVSVGYEYNISFLEDDQKVVKTITVSEIGEDYVIFSFINAEGEEDQVKKNLIKND